MGRNVPVNAVLTLNVEGMDGVQAPTARHARRGSTIAEPSVLHLAVTRSAAVRLAPVAAALPGPQAFVDPTGRVVWWSVDEPPVVSCVPLPSAGDVARAVTVALNQIDADVVLLAGDGDEALAAALAAVRAGVPIARLGAGLRCGDRNAAREINRIAIDELATRLYTDGAIADEQLSSEGVGDERVLRVGSTVPEVVGRWREPALARAAWIDASLTKGEYVLASFRRRETFERAESLLCGLDGLVARHPVVLCLDDAVRDRLDTTGRLVALESAGAVVAGPLEYIEFLSLEAGAGAVLTDSASVQEESSVLQIDCYTLTHSSERVLTLTHGTNLLLGDDPGAIEHVHIRSSGRSGLGADPLPPWDEGAGARIAADLLAAVWQGA
jgi:UDP-N-acetylglucosamine 2-epimerase (non-hydrolysing)